MNYQEEIITEGDLYGAVVCLWQMDGLLQNETEFNARILPNGQSFLIFNFGELSGNLTKPIQVTEGGEFILLPAHKTSFIISQTTYLSFFGISFIGDGLFKLLGRSYQSLSGELNTLLDPLFYDHHTKISKLEYEDRIRETKIFLESLIRHDLNIPELNHVFRLIHHKKGVCVVGEICEKSNIGERQLQRIFKKRIGISPKDYCKLIRVNSYLQDAILNQGNIDWIELVERFGYHDQPHLINEVKSVSKLSPVKLLKFRDSLYAKFLL